MSLNHHAEQPECSICIANFNGEHLLDNCLKSVFNQIGEVDVEVIVHDDASTDNSIFLLEEKYPQVRIIKSTENMGFCIANNRMVQNARGEFLLLLNNDAALHEDALQTFLKETRSQSNRGIFTLPQYDWESGTLVDRGCLLDPLNVPVPNLDSERSDVAFTVGACLWVSRKDWQALGGFPDWLESIGEDLYLCCAARLRGWQIRCLPISGYRHRQGTSFGGNRVSTGGIHTRYRRRYLSERNRLSVFIACTPTIVMWPWLAFQVMMLLLEGGLLSLFLRSTRPWREIYAAALRDTWRRRRPILTLRRSLQAKRICTLSSYLRVFTPWPRKLAVLLRNGLPRLS